MGGGQHNITRGAALGGLAQVSPIVARYTKVEVMYIQEKNTRLEEEFEKGIVSLYTEILKYQVAAACHCRRSTFQRFLRALPQPDDWKGMIENIKEKDVVCQNITQVFESQDQKLANFKLQSLAERNNEMMDTFLRHSKELRRSERRKIPEFLVGFVVMWRVVTIKVSWSKGRWVLNMRAQANGYSGIRFLQNGPSLKTSSDQDFGMWSRRVREELIGFAHHRVALAKIVI